MGRDAEAKLAVWALLCGALVVVLRGSGHTLAAEFPSVAFLGFVTHVMRRSSIFPVLAEPPSDPNLRLEPPSR